jgi:uncharacterized membrane protein
MNERSYTFAARKSVLAGLLVLITFFTGGARAAGQVDAQCNCATGPHLYSVINLGGDEYWGAYLNQKGQIAAFGNERNRFFDAGRWYDVGSLGGGYTFVRALNNRGVVVGESLDASEPFGNILAFWWTARHGMRALPGLSVTSAVAINDRNQIAGYTAAAAPGIAERAVRWDPNGRTVNLGPLPLSLSEALAINNNGESGGFTDFADGTIHATKWTAAGDLVDLGSLGNPDFASTAFLNERGDAAGQSGNDGFYWSQRTGMIAIGSRVTEGVGQLVGLGGGGEIVGNTEVPGGRAAFLWTQARGLQLLPRGGAINTSVWGMNGRADMVGAVERTADDFRAVRWHGLANPVDLNAHLYRPPPGLVVTQGLAINDRGDIVAYSNAGIVLLRPGTTGTDAPVLGPVVGLPRVVHVGDDLEFTLGFVDNSPTQTHTVAISWDDGCADNAPPPTLHESGGVGQVTFRHAFCRVGPAGVWIKITDSAGRVTELLKQTYSDDPANVTLHGRGMLASGRGAAPLHFALWVPFNGNAVAAASGVRSGVPFVRLGGPVRFESEQVAAPVQDGQLLRVEGTGRLNGRPGYRFRLETVDNTSWPASAAQLRVRVFHVDSGGEHVDYDSLAPVLPKTKTVRSAGPGAIAKIASGWINLSR